jgi:hypothetical protein
MIRDVGSDADNRSAACERKNGLSCEHQLAMLTTDKRPCVIDGPTPGLSTTRK